MQKMLLSIILIAILPLTTFAAKDTTLDQLRAQSNDVKASEIDLLNAKEEERTQQIANLLGFILPEYTDNPSYVVTFKDPSPSKKGVEVSLDGASFTTIKSPYTFPALNIGNHEVKFRFNDETDTVKILEYGLTVLPRAPIIDSPKIEDNTITITGKALSNSQIIYTISANAYNDTGLVNTNGDGDWSLQITPQEGLLDGIYTFSAITRKYGYASDIATPITFIVGENTPTSNTQESKDIYFAFKDISKDNIIEIIKNNRDLAILSISFFLLGIFLTIILKSLIDSKKDRKNYTQVETILNKKEHEENKESKTLREIFGNNSKEEDEKEKEKDIKPKESDIKADVKEKVEPTKHESIINKDVFLSRYRNIDPDDETGKEKKKVRISLTSKNE